MQEDEVYHIHLIWMNCYNCGWHAKVKYEIWTAMSILICIECFHKTMAEWAGGNKFSYYCNLCELKERALTYLCGSHRINTYYITCTKILVLLLDESHSLVWLFIASGDKTFHCTPFGSARVQKLFTIALSVHICIWVLSISNTIFGRLF